ncbi:cytochrome C [Caldilinea sp.]|uniref:cytochrome C n=1 Tax=Caldilinea sp. TaxID=2293560 RepID=UPI002C82265E|nr:cytochrome C [Caldilinea sp.]HRA68405.1 cytochrome C [Caldilinea sp.]
MSGEIDKILGPRIPADDFKANSARYIIPTLLFVAAAVLLIISIQRPWWRLKLNAPQYPAGLYVTAYVNRMTGDVHEIDGLNHYIGMRPLSEAAVFEQSISVFGIIALAMLILAAAFVHSRWAALLALPALLLPVFFLVDLQFWLANFGLNLDPTAALSSSVDPFIPPVLWTGTIAQFSTVPRLLSGFWLSLWASGLILVGLFFHRRAYKPLVEAQEQELGQAG